MNPVTAVHSLDTIHKLDNLQAVIYIEKQENEEGMNPSISLWPLGPSMSSRSAPPWCVGAWV
ncbi:hypothetical protein JZ751_011809 [Albula glossodonta]|uniref:Uncharacterized protein n=1 Tax=Albula glossodonta TaxID=121402 RepID=A0A8T2PQN5_9TELE|nr:hypothetical protein JZ751_011809 [Albula glossodonta]